LSPPALGESSIDRGDISGKVLQFNKIAI